MIIILENYGFLRTTSMNQFRSFESLGTTVMKIKNHIDSWQGFGANSNTAPILGSNLYEECATSQSSGQSTIQFTHQILSDMSTANPY